ncbi:LAMI_0G01750g1_1 [Lachancea mirantina]|uniref:LAMI_0G01750g1_1 n=1 Tax=Lachancea mirantina TaxID=1230905 RepID=A0A1G4K7K3_9SACH|nr:LAMI_0G01750g1_1 [Lachancea mirantina]
MPGTGESLRTELKVSGEAKKGVFRLQETGNYPGQNEGDQDPGKKNEESEPLLKSTASPIGNGVGRESAPQLSRASSRDSVPAYRPVDENRYVNSHKLRVVTSNGANDSATTNNENNANVTTRSASGPATSGPLTGSLGSALVSGYPSVAGTAVSFTVGNFADKISHRGSISARPSSGAVNLQNGTAPPPENACTARPEVGSEPTSSANSVHMPGDFVVMQPSTGHESDHSTQNLSSANSSAAQQASRKHFYQGNKAIVDMLLAQRLPFTEFFQKQDDGKIHILIGATGSVATVKVPMMIDKLFKIYGSDKVSIQLVLTKRAEHFLRGTKISTDVKIWRDEDEWFGFKRMGDPVVHTELRRWADICVIAPLSANTLAKIANGICDNLLTSLLRSWTPSTPVLVAPAMNTFMYIHPVTKKHLAMLREDSPFVDVLKPVEKVLICGDIGMGGMREWNDIVDIVVKRIADIRGNLGSEANARADGNEEDDDEDEDDEDEDDEDEDDEDDEDDDDEDDEDDDVDKDDN